MKAQENEYGPRLLTKILDIKAIIFSFTVLHLMAMVVYVVRYNQKYSTFPSRRDPTIILNEPLLLLLAAATLLVSKPWSYLISILASARVIYVLGYLGLIATSSAHDHPVYSWYVIKTWWIMMFTAQPQYIVELVLAAVIGTYSIFLLIRHLRKF